MQHRIILSKALLIAIKNKKQLISLVPKKPVNDTEIITADLSKRYVRYVTLSGMSRRKIEEIYN